MIHERILAALNKSYPPSDRSWMELEEMARSAPETAIDLIVELAETPLDPIQRGWLAAGPLRSALSSANPAEESELESRTENDSTFAAMLDALIRYEQKQQIVISILEGAEPGPTPVEPETRQIIIPNIHQRPRDQALGQEEWNKVVSAVGSAPESALLMLASTVLEMLLLQNETAFRDAILSQMEEDEKFRRALSYCDLAFSEPFLDEMIGKSSTASRQSSE